MLRRVWAKVNTADTWKAKVEEHIWRDGTIEYSFRDRFGRTFSVKDFAEAQRIIEEFKMTDVTDEMFKGGWIHPDVYREVISQREAV